MIVKAGRLKGNTGGRSFCVSCVSSVFMAEFVDEIFLLSL